MLAPVNCKRASLGIVAHAESKWRDAEALAGLGSYSSAIAWKIIALEEMAKAVILAVDAHGFQFRKLEHLKVLQSSHQQRHILILLVAVFDLLGRNLRNGVAWLKANDEFVRSFMHVQKSDEDRASQDLIRRFSSFYQESLGPALVELSKWAAFLADLRNEQTYSDYQANLRTPLDTSVDDYNLRCVRLDAAYLALGSTCDWLNHAQEKELEWLGKLRETFESRFGYDGIDAFIAEHLAKREAMEKIVDVANKSILALTHIVEVLDREQVQPVESTGK